MIAEDPALALPALPPLTEPLGSLETDLLDELSAAHDAAFTVTGRRAWVTGGAGRGIDDVVMPPDRSAAGPRLAGARCERAFVTPLGVERRLGVGDAVVVERVAVPRDGRVALLEWHAPDRAVTLTLDWVAGPEPGDAAPASSADRRRGPGRPSRWRRAERGLVVDHGGGFLVAFVFSAVPDPLIAEWEPAGLRVSARLKVPAGDSLRLAVVCGAGAAELDRGLRMAGRARSLVQARRGAVERLGVDRLSVSTPDPALDRALEWAKIRLAGRIVETPGTGRSIIAGHDIGRAAYVTAEAVHAALDGLSTGDYDSARDVLAFLTRRQLDSGHVPGSFDLAGRAGHASPAATLLYLVLVARFLDTTGDLPFLQAEWPAVRRAWDAIGHAGGSADEVAVRTATGRGLARVAEAIGDARAAVEIRRALHGRDGADPEDADGSTGTAAQRAGAGVHALAERARRTGPVSHDPTGVIPFLQGVMGAEPDATRGRLVLRPRPPEGWARFRATSLAMGDARFTLEYRREGPIHRFAVRQDRGAAPVRLILEPELTGRLLAARVDGEAAELAAVEAGGRTRVPVQLALDHERMLELVMEERDGEAEPPAAPVAIRAGQKKTPDG